MNLENELKIFFSSLQTGSKPIVNIDPLYPAYAIRINGEYGVAIKLDNTVVVAERFNECHFYTENLTIGGVNGNYLLLTASVEGFRNEFAFLCMGFIDPGFNGEKRRSIMDNPHAWWIEWTQMVGNTTKDKKVYSVIAELIVLNHKFALDPSANWTASRMGTHDIECSAESCEVKSTIKRYGADITVSSQHQLFSTNPLYLYFLRMEASNEGVSIDDMKEILALNGYDGTSIETELQRQGFEKGSLARQEKYKVLEKRIYTIDANFPKITANDFVGGKFPDAIVKIEYTIDLDGVHPYTTW